MKTVVGSFDSFDEAKAVARDLIDAGFRDSDVSVVASNVRGQPAGSEAPGTVAPGSTVPGSTAPGTTVPGTAAAGTAVPGTKAAESTAPGTTAPGTMTPGTTSGAYATAGAPATDQRLTTDAGGLTDERAVADDASSAAAGAVTGGVVGGAAGLAASLMGLAIPGIGPIIAAGPIVATLTGAGVGAVAGGLIGGLTDMGVSRADAEYYAESVRRGGALVTVRTDDSRAERAAEIMREHGAIDIERRAEQWRERGWTGFNESAQPYTPEEVNRERDVYGDTDRTTGIASGPTIGAGALGDRGTAGSPSERGTPKTTGGRTY